MPFAGASHWQMWDKSIRALDWLAIVTTALMAVVTLWAASYPVVDTAAQIFAGAAWSFVAIVWIVSVAATTNDTGSRALALVLLVGAVASIPFFGFSFLLLAFLGAVGLAAAVVAGLALLASIVLLSRPRRVAWLVAPAIVLVMFAVIASGVPRLARLAVAEPALVSFAQSLQQSQGSPLPVYFDEGLSVGSIPIYAAYNESGGLLFVTGYVGMLDDYEAGLAYFPDGAPADGSRYEHLLGDWYRWYSCCSD